MTPDKAKELIQEYADVNRKIKDTKSQIGSALDKCQGISGKRKNGISLDFEDSEPTHDSKGRELNLHLTQWYTPYVDDYNELEYNEITEEHGVQCPHCYAAHLLIQDRKKLRKRFGTIKGMMSRTKESEWVY